jgi:aryl-alcohol dehydrogenase-like predicted oxidoreductase
MEAVAKLIQQGKVRYAGVCNYDASQMAEAEKYISVVSDQVPYSMVNRGIETELVPYCLNHNKSILAYSPLERGLLTGKMRPGHQFAEGDHRKFVSFFTDENIKRTDELLQEIKPIADENGLTLSQLVLQWTLEQPGITIALVGARDSAQAKVNAKALDKKLSAEDIKNISAHLDQLELVF